MLQSIWFLRVDWTEPKCSQEVVLKNKDEKTVNLVNSKFHWKYPMLDLVDAWGKSFQFIIKFSKENFLNVSVMICILVQK